MDVACYDSGVSATPRNWVDANASSNRSQDGVQQGGRRTAGRFDRREFSRSLVGIPIGSGILSGASSLASAQNPEQFLAVVGKDPRLLVHDAVTGVAETPVQLLRKHRLTPKDILFVRNNQVLSGGLTLSPYVSTGWDLELTGLVTPAPTVRFSELGQLTQTETIAVLQCAGNGRAFYGQTAKAKGTQWQRGGMGQVRWRGVRLKQLLDSFDLLVGADAEFLTAEGRDSASDADGDDFEQSVPLADVLDTALLATHMNGEPIPAIHGGPLRLVLPGYYGSMNVKWLSRLRFERQGSTSRHHAQRYRTFRERIEPGASPKVTEETTIPTWRQKIKSVIWNPESNERRMPGPLKVSGVAWNDGRTEIVAVELSVDGGNTWRRARIEAPLGPYGWYPWSVNFWYGWNRRLSQGGTAAEFRVRAFDAFGRSQPDDGSVHWNPSGYEWFGVDTVKVQLR